MTAPGAILVFDLGTTNFKATLFGLDGVLLALARVPTPFTNTRGAHSEIAVPDFDAALLALAGELRSQAPDAWAATRAVTFASQTNSFVLLDANHVPLTPFVVWNDRRAVNSSTLLERLQILPGFYETTGVPGLSPEFMAAKLHWFQTQTPELWERVARIALISDYFTWRFTGQFVSEAGAAGLTGLVDIHRADWWPAALDVAGLERDTLSDIVRAGANLGAIAPEAAATFNLPAGGQFVVGCLDQYAGAIGAGNVVPGGISETTGTVLATVRCAGHFTVQSGSPVFWGPAAAPGHYYQMVFGDKAGNLLEAYRNALPEPVAFEVLGDAAASATGGRLVLPRGLDTPELLEHVRVWARNEPTGEAVRAILEGVAAALKVQVDQLCGTERPAELHSVGGAARSWLWMQIKANVAGLPVRAVRCPEPTSLGAALLAVAAITETPLAELLPACVQLEPVIHPDGQAARVSPLEIGLLSTRKMDMANVHKDFHGAFSYGIQFIIERYGLDGLRDYLERLADTVYAPLVKALEVEGLLALREHWERIFALEGGRIELRDEGETLVLEVLECPAITHMKTQGYTIDPHFCEHTRILNDAICTRAGYRSSVEYDQNAGRCVQRFWKE